MKYNHKNTSLRLVIETLNSLFRNENLSVYISFHCVRKEMKFIFALIFWATIFVFRWPNSKFWEKNLKFNYYRKMT